MAEDSKARRLTAADLVERLGSDVAHALISTFGGERCTIPSQSDLDTYERNRRIRDLHAHGLSTKALSERFNLSEKQLLRIIFQQN